MMSLQSLYLVVHLSIANTKTEQRSFLRTASLIIILGTNDLIRLAPTFGRNSSVLHSDIGH
jgi:hypothetical protein